MGKQFGSPLPGGFPNIPSSVPEDAVSVVNEKPPTVFSQFSETPQNSVYQSQISAAVREQREEGICRRT